MTSGVSSATSANGANTGQTPTPATGINALAQKDTFLKLLVAQIKNQDPLNPTDGIQFVSQLAQFSELEQVMQIRQYLEAAQNNAKTSTTDQSGSTNQTQGG